MAKASPRVDRRSLVPAVVVDGFGAVTTDSRR